MDIRIDASTVVYISENGVAAAVRVAAAAAVAYSGKGYNIA